MVKYMNKEITMPYFVNGQPATKEQFDAVYKSAKASTGDVLGEPGIYQQNGYTGVNLDSGATVVYKDLRRRKHGGSGAGSAAFAATDPHRRMHHHADQRGVVVFLGPVAPGQAHAAHQHARIKGPQPQVMGFGLAGGEALLGPGQQALRLLG